jgi:hypothetical protein
VAANSNHIPFKTGLTAPRTKVLAVDDVRFIIVTHTGACHPYPVSSRQLGLVPSILGVMAIAIFRARAGAWRLIAALVVIAFSFQSHLAQTHIHQTAAAISSAAHYSGQNKSPADNSPLDCPFCQVVSHTSGFFISDASLLLVVPQWTEMAIPRHLLATTDTAIGHHWQSRAPPTPLTD